ncbi:MAG: hypothetical protein ACYC7A_19105 [Thermoanaerobaculia bacterium]
MTWQGGAATRGGLAFLLARRNLWAPVLAHDLIDTVGIVALYFGFAD